MTAQTRLSQRDLADSRRLEPLVRALNALGYQPIETAKYYQFVKPGPHGGEAGAQKIDLLAAPRATLKAHGVVAQERRAYPRPKIPLHAHPVDEALTLEEHLQSVVIEGHLSDGTPAQSEVFLPHAFTYILMKCFALRDRINDEEKDYGRHHALDLYTIVAMMTEDDWETALTMRDMYCEEAIVIEAAEVVHHLFSNDFDLGVLRLKESSYYRPVFQVRKFREALCELL